MNITQKVCILLTIAIIIYDVIIYVTKGVDLTISRTVYWAAEKNPAITFATGVLLSHLFWAQKV